MQISRKIGATMTASGKLAHDKVFLINFITKRHLKKKIALQSKKVNSSKSLH